ncbi:hypothetical protein JKP88DRAFT_246732 [Tribonema minus]|uniref:Uncharacterized protein n=1 Tax=Tribonema minus TaxID=303371 RepID=A0A836CBU8_9STRA|nr:hypothetical protein JKP88DRAFT_246732 [Tribonema minus]
MQHEDIIALLERDVARIDSPHHLMPLARLSCGDHPLGNGVRLAFGGTGDPRCGCGGRSGASARCTQQVLALGRESIALEAEYHSISLRRTPASSSNGRARRQRPQQAQCSSRRLHLLQSCYLRDRSGGVRRRLLATRAALHTPASFRFALDNGMALSATRTQRAIGATGSVEMIDIAAAANMPLALPVFRGASSTGKAGLLHHIHAASSTRTFQSSELVIMCLEAAKGGDKGQALAWLSQLFSPAGSWPVWLRRALCHAAIEGKHTETLEWLFADDAVLFGPLSDVDPDEDNAFAVALDFLDPPITNSLVDHALEVGKCGMVHFLLAEGQQFTGRSCVFAIRSGSAAMLDIITANGAPIDFDEVLDEIIAGDRLSLAVVKGLWNWSSTSEQRNALLPSFMSSVSMAGPIALRRGRQPHSIPRDITPIRKWTNAPVRYKQSRAGAPDRMTPTQQISKVLLNMAHTRLLPKEGWGLCRQLANIKPPLTARVDADSSMSRLAHILRLPTLERLYLEGVSPGASVQASTSLRYLKLERVTGHLHHLPHHLDTLTLWRCSVTDDRSRFPPQLRKLTILGGTLGPRLTLPQSLEELRCCVCSFDFECTHGTVQQFPILPAGLRSLSLEDMTLLRGDAISLGNLPPAMQSLYLNDFGDTDTTLPLTLRYLHLRKFDFGQDIELPEGLRSLLLCSIKRYLAAGCRMPALPTHLSQLVCWVEDDGAAGTPTLSVRALPPNIEVLQLQGVRLCCAVPATVRSLRMGDTLELGVVYDSGRSPTNVVEGARDADIYQ